MYPAGAVFAAAAGVVPAPVRSGVGEDSTSKSWGDDGPTGGTVGEGGGVTGDPGGLKGSGTGRTSFSNNHFSYPSIW